MFSVQQKRKISEEIQKLLRATDHPELPPGEIQFLLHVDGAESWSWADIRNNGSVPNPGVNPWNERQAKASPDLDALTTALLKTIENPAFLMENFEIRFGAIKKILKAIE